MNGIAANARESERAKFRDELRSMLGKMGDMSGVFPADQYRKRVDIGKLRRRGASRGIDPTRTLTLIQDEDGVLFWEDGAILPMSVSRLRRGLPGSRRGNVVDHLVVEPLEPSKVGEALSWADARFTPSQGLREWNGEVLLPPNEGLRPAGHGRILLVIHGTFSQSQAIFSQLTDNNKMGKKLLARAGKHYKQILAFDHPTLSVSPILNALDIARRFEGSQAEVDIICHSRGGLVTRWWLEAFNQEPGRKRAILVGAPLGGTSLASPPRLRHVLSWFSNLNQALAKGAGAASSLIPFMAVVSCLTRFTAVVSSLAAHTPVVDAAVAMIPGLAGMSRISNNAELSRLNAGKGPKIDYFVIKSQYSPKNPGWKVWEYFGDPLKRFATTLFAGENDLVVDTASMGVFRGDETAKSLYDFGTTSEVFHTNYFAQTKTCEQIIEWLQIP